MSSRVFHDLLARVGDEGRYQYISVAIFCLAIVPIISIYYISPFLFYQPPYQCPQSINNCHEYVCSLPQSDRATYTAQFSSMVSRFGDYRCNPSALALPQTIGFMGTVCGALIGIILSTRLTHHKTAVFSLTVSVIGVFLLLIAPNLAVACVGLFLSLLGATIFCEIETSYMSQIISERLRVNAIMVNYVFYASGAALTALFFWVVHPWQLAVALYLLLPLVVSLLGTVFFLEQTPLDLVVNQPPESALASFRRIASWNGVGCDIQQPEVAQIKEEYLSNQLQLRQQHSVSVFDLCRYDSLRSLFIICTICRFFNAFSFYAPEIVLSDFAQNIYINGILLGSSQFFSSLVMLFVLDRISRRKGFIVSSAAGALIAIFLFAFYSCQGSSQCSATQNNIQTIGLFLMRMATNIAYVIFYVYKNEVFPSQIRVTALQITGLSGRVGILLIPAVQELFHRLNTSIILSFFIAAFIMAVLGTQFKETLGVLPPEVIEQLDDKRQQDTP